MEGGRIMAIATVDCLLISMAVVAGCAQLQFFILNFFIQPSRHKLEEFLRLHSKPLPSSSSAPKELEHGELHVQDDDIKIASHLKAYGNYVPTISTALWSSNTQSTHLHGRHTFSQSVHRSKRLEWFEVYLFCPLFLVLSLSTLYHLRTTLPPPTLIATSREISTKTDAAGAQVGDAEKGTATMDGRASSLLPAGWRNKYDRITWHRWWTTRATEWCVFVWAMLVVLKPLTMTWD
jgi:hypothetical protein